MTKGITKSCPLSSVLGAIYLEPLDRAMAQLPVKYIRYMDDWIILAKTRWQLRKAIKKCNQILNELKLEKAPDKTFIGRTEKGFDFCGFRFNAEGVFDLASKTKERFREKVSKLYEQPRKQNAEEQKSIDALKRYIKKFEGWVKGVIGRTRSEKISRRLHHAVERIFKERGLALHSDSDCAYRSYGNCG